MRYPHITSRIFNTPLLIHPQKLDAIIAGIGSRTLGLSPEQFNFQQDNAIDLLPAELFSTKRGVRNQERGYRVIDGVAVINISGATVHRSRMEAPSSFLLGYDDITADIEHAMNNPDVHAVLRVYDSPGGEAQGAFEHADRMAALLGKKPMVSIADGMAASAGYLASSASDELVITNTGYVGSIGVVMRHVDLSRALANEGVNVTHIYAGAHKIDGNQFAPLPDAVRADFQQEINGLYDLFVEAVSKHRNLKADAIRATEAATFRGEHAVANGLADRVSTTDQILAELAAKRSSKAYSISNSPNQAKANQTAALSGEQQVETVSLNSTKGVTTMKLEDLRTAHPDLCAALVEEGRIAGFEAGAIAEQQRIKDVEAQAMPGHESLIANLKFDGKTTGPEAAVQVLAAERALQKEAAKTIAASAPAAVVFAAAPNDAATDQAQEDQPIEAKAQDVWNKSASLQAEFGGNFNTYLAYCTAEATGRVKVANKKD